MRGNGPLLRTSDAIAMMPQTRICRGSGGGHSTICSRQQLAAANKQTANSSARNEV